MEIERKWMVKGWPEGLPLREEFAMRQGYISVRPTVRIREEALTGGRTDYILCFKSGGGLAREEIERSIDKELFDDLEYKIIAKPLIPKLRRSYTLPDGSVLEVNHVDEGQPTEFWYAEVEYPTVEAALAWQPESCGLGDYLKDEVTNQCCWFAFQQLIMIAMMPSPRIDVAIDVSGTAFIVSRNCFVKTVSSQMRLRSLSVFS